MAKDKIRFMLSAQVDNGGGLPLVKFDHNAGHEDTLMMLHMFRQQAIQPIVLMMLFGSSLPYISIWQRLVTRHFG